jgi:hypothetical protein
MILLPVSASGCGCLTEDLLARQYKARHIWLAVAFLPIVRLKCILTKSISGTYPRSNTLIMRRDRNGRIFRFIAVSRIRLILMSFRWPLV